MAVYICTKGNSSYFLAKRMIKGELHQKYFPYTAKGQRDALRMDRELTKVQKASSPLKSTYIKSKYGFLRGIFITYDIYEGRFYTVLGYFFKSGGTTHHRVLQVRCGRTMRACYNELVEDIESILKPNRNAAYIKLVAHTYKYVKAADAQNRAWTAGPKPKGATKKRLK